MCEDGGGRGCYVNMRGGFGAILHSLTSFSTSESNNEKASPTFSPVCQRSKKGVKANDQREKG